MNIDDWKSQLKRGILEYCILLMISKKPYYGYELISDISQWDIIAAKENTIYPLLRRLQKEDYLEAVWQDSHEGLPPRKYYTLTALGSEYLELMKVEWGHLVELITELRDGKEDKNE